MPLRETEEQVHGGPDDRHTMMPDAPWLSWTDAVNRLWFQKTKIAKWVAAGLVLSLFFVWKYSKFEATVQLMPPDSAQGGMAALLPSLGKIAGGSSSGLAGLAGDLLGSKSSGALFAKVLGSRTIQDDMINRFDLRGHYWRRYYVDARKDLTSATRIEEDKKSGVLTITVRDRDPKTAVALAGAYISELDDVMVRVATSSARRERIFIEQRLTDEKKALQASEQRFSQFSSGSMALDVPQQIRVTVESAARLEGELIAARAELGGLQQIYTAENTRVRTLQARVAELEQALRKINSGNSGGGKSQSAAKDATYPYPSVKELPQLGVQWADLYRETKVHETVFEMLTQQYEIARIQEAKEIPTVKVLDPPAMPEKRYPRPWTIMLIGAVASALLACTGVLLHDRWEALDVADPRRILLSNIYFSSRNSIRSVWKARRPGGSQKNDERDQKL